MRLFLYNKKIIVSLLSLLLLIFCVPFPVIADEIHITNKGDSSDYPQEAKAGQYYTFTVRWHQDYASDGALFIISGDLEPLVEDSDALPPGSHYHTFSFMIPEDGRTSLRFLLRMLVFHPEMSACDGMEDEDNCPDIFDRYEWYVAVVEDPCEKDSDGDGINDCDDWCPYEEEDYNGYQDADGCPDTLPDEDCDNGKDDDGDGKVDCEDDPDCDSCEKDSDGDGINDCDDWCPYEEEDYNGYQDADGCPDTLPINLLKTKISFKITYQNQYYYAYLFEDTSIDFPPQDVNNLYIFYDTLYSWRNWLILDENLNLVTDEHIYRDLAFAAQTAYEGVTHLIPANFESWKQQYRKVLQYSYTLDTLQLIGDSAARLLGGTLSGGSGPVASTGKEATEEILEKMINEMSDQIVSKVKNPRDIFKEMMRQMMNTSISDLDEASEYIGPIYEKFKDEYPNSDIHLDYNDLMEFYENAKSGLCGGYEGMIGLTTTYQSGVVGYLVGVTESFVQGTIPMSEAVFRLKSYLEAYQPLASFIDTIKLKNQEYRIKKELLEEHAIGFLHKFRVHGTVSPEIESMDFGGSHVYGYNSVSEQVKNYVDSIVSRNSELYSQVLVIYDEEILEGNDLGFFPEDVNESVLSEMKDSGLTILIGSPLRYSDSLKYQEYLPLKVTDEYPGKHKGLIEVIDNPFDEGKIVLLAGSDREGTKAAVEIFKTLEDLPEKPLIVSWNNEKGVKIEKRVFSLIPWQWIFMGLIVISGVGVAIVYFTSFSVARRRRIGTLLLLGLMGALIGLLLWYQLSFMMIM